MPASVCNVWLNLRQVIEPLQPPVVSGPETFCLSQQKHSRVHDTNQDRDLVLFHFIRPKLNSGFTHGHFTSQWTSQIDSPDLPPAGSEWKSLPILPSFLLMFYSLSLILISWTANCCAVCGTYFCSVQLNVWRLLPVYSGHFFLIMNALLALEAGRYHLIIGDLVQLRCGHYPTFLFALFSCRINL